MTGVVPEEAKDEPAVWTNSHPESVRNGASVHTSEELPKFCRPKECDPHSNRNPSIVTCSAALLITFTLPEFPAFRQSRVYSAATASRAGPSPPNDRMARPSFEAGIDSASAAFVTS